MSYMSTVASTYIGGKPETRIDLRQLVIDVAKELGGKAVFDSDKMISDRHGKISISDDTVIEISANTWDKRIVVGICLTDRVAWNDRPSGEEYKTPSASMSPDKSAEKLARDIKRRIIGQSAAPLQKMRDYIAMRGDQKGRLLKVVAELQKVHPLLSIRVADHGLSAELYLNTDGIYFSGSVSHDGSVSFQRVGSMDIGKFAKVIQILTSE